MWMKLAGMDLTAEDVIERGGIGSPSVRSPHFPLQKLAAVHPEGRCDWLSCQVGRSGPKSYPTQTVRTSCWPVACGQLPRGLSCKVRNRSSHCGWSPGRPGSQNGPSPCPGRTLRRSRRRARGSRIRVGRCRSWPASSGLSVGRIRSATSAPLLRPRPECSGRAMSPCFHRPWCWTAAVGSSSSGTNPVGQRLAGQAEDRCGGVRAVGLDSAHGAGGGLGECHCRRVRLILALLQGSSIVGLL